jgi:hypothetical protein
MALLEAIGSLNKPGHFIEGVNQPLAASLSRLVHVTQLIRIEANPHALSDPPIERMRGHTDG